MQLQWLLPTAMAVVDEQLLLDAGVPVDGIADETPLFRAAERGWKSLLAVLIARGANVHTRNYKGNTPLWIAACFRNTDCMTELIAAGADPNAANNKVRGPVSVPNWLVWVWHVCMCAFCIFVCGVFDCGVVWLCAAPAPQLEVPLINSVQKGQQAAVNLLLAAGARVHNILSWAATDALLAGTAPASAVGAAAGTSSSTTAPASTPNTPVLVACRMGFSNVLHTLLSKLRSDDRAVQRLARISSAVTGSAAAAAAAPGTAATAVAAPPSLLAGELQFVASIDGFNALLAAVEQDHAECVNVLVEFGADVECRTGADNPILPSATPLHLAAHYGRVDAARALLLRGCNVNAVDGTGQTAMHIAAKRGHPLMVRLLKSFRADLTLMDDAGRPAAYYCRCVLAVVFKLCRFCDCCLALAVTLYTRSRNPHKLAQNTQANTDTHSLTHSLTRLFKLFAGVWS